MQAKPAKIALLNLTYDYIIVYNVSDNKSPLFEKMIINDIEWRFRVLKINKKIPKTAELMWILGTITVALGVALCKKADLGVSMIAAPTFIIYEAIAPYASWLSVGVTEYIVQGIMIALLCLIVQRFSIKYLFAFIVAVIYGYTLDFWLFVIGNPGNEIWLRWILLIVGDISVAFGVACFFRTYLPLQAYELFVAEVSDRYNVAIAKVKWCFDVSCLLISVILALTLFGDVKEFEWKEIYMKSFHSIGLGTVITTIINAPIIAVFNKLLDGTLDDSALIPKLKDFFEKKAVVKSSKKSETNEN